MDLYEYQARQLFAKHGVPVIEGEVVGTPEAAEEAAARLGGGLTVVKAQVKIGGRGKAGGVKLAHDSAEVREVADAILGMDIKGHMVERVLIVPAADIAHEYYFSILLDRSNRRQLVMCSRQGGMEIEQLAREDPDALVKRPLDSRGLTDEVAREILCDGGFEADEIEALVPVLVQLWEVYRGEDAQLVEVNPLVMCEDGTPTALDGKVTLDDNARFRHPDHGQFIDNRTVNPLEVEAKERGLNYVHLGGEVGIIGNGAGLVMSTLDVVAYAGDEFGVKPANFLDIGGGASAEVMAAGLDIILKDEEVRSVFVNVFGGITACGQVAEGIVKALEMLGERAKKPLVVRLDGNDVEAGRRILEQAQHPLITMVETMDGGAAQAARLAQSK